jgi:hypothetical protein
MQTAGKTTKKSCMKNLLLILVLPLISLQAFALISPRAITPVTGIIPTGK